MASARTAHQPPLDPDEQALFLAEAHDQIEAFRMAVAALAAGDVESVHPAFRAIHTLKGSAAAAGYEDLVHAAHSTEAALERLRAARAVPGRALADSLREAGLRLAGLTDAVADAHDNALPTLRSIGGPSRPGRRRSPHSLTFGVELADDGFAGVRALQLFEELRTIGALTALHPGQYAIEAGEAGTALHGLLATRQEKESVIALLASLPGVVNVTVELAAPRDEAGDRSRGPRRPHLALLGRTQDGDAVRLAATVDEARPERLSLIAWSILSQASRLALVADSLAHAGEAGAAQTLAFEVRNAAAAVSRAAEELASEVRQANLTILEPTFARLRRLVRDTPAAFAVAARLELDGADLELPHRASRAATAALIQLARNALAHGIESPEERTDAGKSPAGLIRVRATRLAHALRIEFSDDGRGIDLAALEREASERGYPSHEPRTLLQLASLPGISTVARPGKLSGRGVGLDIVRSSVEAIGGTVTLDSQPGAGTVCTLVIPLTTPSPLERLP